MRSITQEKTALGIRERFSMQFSRERIWELVGNATILLLAAWLRFSNLDSLGYVNHYYTAGVKSMLQSWHNFFYAAAEPGGSVSIDKPPVGLWLQVISAYFLGVNGLGVILPQFLAGILSVAVLYHLVRRTFGLLPGLLAALALAITPIAVATDRNNTIDSTLILALLLAAWAFIKATETGKIRFLLLGVTLVGIGFNIKMLQAYLPLPAFYAVHFLGSREGIWRKIGKLALATVLLEFKQKLSSSNKIKFISLEDFRGEYSAYLEKTHSATYLADVKCTFDALLKTLDNIPLSKISTRHLEKFLLDVFNKTKYGAKLHYNNLRSAFNKAVCWGYLNENPLRKFRLPKIPSSFPAFINNEELNSIIQKADNLDLKDFFLMAYHTGMRRDEIQVLKWSSINLKDKAIIVSNSNTFTTKTSLFSSAIGWARSVVSCKCNPLRSGLTSGRS